MHLCVRGWLRVKLKKRVFLSATERKVWLTSPLSLWTSSSAAFLPAASADAAAADTFALPPPPPADLTPAGEVFGWTLDAAVDDVIMM